MLTTVGVLVCAWAVLAPQGEIPPAVERVYQRDAYQRRLPWSEAPKSDPSDASDPGRAPRKLRGSIEAPPEQVPARPPERLRGLGAVANAFVTIGAVAFAVIVLIALVLAARGLKLPPGDRDRPAEKVARIEAVELPEAAAAGSTLLDADALARAGRFGDAIHVLLLRALEIVVQKTGTALPTASTSREVLRTAKLAEEMRAPLRVLVQGTERAVFARDPLGARDFEFCRDAFARLGAAAT